MQDWEEEIRRQAQQIADGLNESGLSIPDNATKDEAVQAIKQQLTSAGLAPTDADARHVYRRYLDEQS